MLSNKPLKVGQALIHDVLGRVVFTEKCMELERENTSKVLMYVDDGVEVKLVSRSCLHYLVADAPQSLLDELEGHKLFEALQAEGLIESVHEVTEPCIKEVVVSSCPVCSAQETIKVNESYPEVSPEVDMCADCARKYGEM